MEDSPTPDARSRARPRPHQDSSEEGPASRSSTSEHKVQIPRLQRTNPAKSSASSERQRVSHACEQCRRRKSKCDGVQPTCSRCRDNNLACVYADSKKDRMKRDVQNMITKLSTYETLLSDLLPSLDLEKQQTVRNTLGDLNRSMQDADLGSAGEGTASVDDGNEDEPDPRSEGSALRDATGEIAGTVGSIGYLGRSSAAWWLTELTLAMDVNNSGQAPQGQPFASFGSANRPDEFQKLLVESCHYFTDYYDLSDFGVFGENVSASQLPPRQTADYLVHTYFANIHPYFPVLKQHEFMIQYQSIFDIQHPPCGGVVWAGILNTVFALGALYSQRCRSPFAAGANGHVLYFLRSRILSQEPTQMNGLRSLEHVQYMAITSFYFFVSNQMNRAWALIGLAYRYATSRGLHLFSATDESDGQGEYHARLWRCVCSLEHLLCVWTGRPSAIPSQRFPSDWPFKGGEVGVDTQEQLFSQVQRQAESPVIPGPAHIITPAADMFTVSLYLDRLGSEVLEQLYGPHAVNFVWADMQRLVSDLNAKLSRWYSSLPGDLKLPTVQPSYPRREQLYLALRVHSLRILINWPSLHSACDIGTFAPTPETFTRFDAEAAEHCKTAARAIMGLIPDADISPALYESIPWWCISHFVMQAGAVLVAVIHSDSLQTPVSEKQQLLVESINGLRWLMNLSENDATGHKAWYSLGQLLLLAATKTGMDVSLLSSFVPASLLSPDKGASLALASYSPVYF
ncbi:hypothetical protein VTN31DRAFT_1119 [Thermomyces dupontii]|uniref:uncharacterized protein n=1 Tax=Talaromyces thermophilus TaxID=28565 RepID=UPI003744864B